MKKNEKAFPLSGYHAACSSILTSCHFTSTLDLDFTVRASHLAIGGSTPPQREKTQNIFFSKFSSNFIENDSL